MSDDVKAFNTNEKNFGLEPLTTPLSEPDRKLSALMLAVNTAVAQFVAEGVFNPADQIHFMIHLQEFMAKFYAGEVVRINGIEQTLTINSALGKLFLDSANDGLVNGKENVRKMHEAIRAANEAALANKQTTLDGEQDANAKPKWLN